MAHSSSRKKLRINRKGYSAIIGTIFMVLIILFLYFNVFTFSLNRNTDFQDVISRSEQLDADRNAEQITITNSFLTFPSGQIKLYCTLSNNGTVPVQLGKAVGSRRQSKAEQRCESSPNQHAYSIAARQ